jgi:hypothetical protein
MPLGALVAGPLATAIGVTAVQFGAAGLILVAAALALLPSDVRAMRNLPAEETVAAASSPEPVSDHVPSKETYS